MKGLSIGIGGVSRAGKTTLSRYIKSLYPTKSVYIIQMDEYVKKEADIPKIKNYTDWEHPISVDFDRINHALKEALSTYDIVVTEGILIFYSKNLNKLFDRRIFIKVPKNVFYNRRKEDKRWGEEPDWYLEYVWNSYLKYGKSEDCDNSTLYILGTEDWSPTLIDEYLFKIEHIPFTS